MVSSQKNALAIFQYSRVNIGVLFDLSRFSISKLLMEEKNPARRAYFEFEDGDIEINVFCYTSSYSSSYYYYY